ncbi:MAG: hypothetical protein WA004_11420 [Saprospiraceae bacterium]
MKSPFKFLDPYDQSDKDSFFGRDEEIEALYQMVGQNRLVLVYGQSGTGKTSLIQCGLANKFDSTEWHPFLIRRKSGNDINVALKQALSIPLGGKTPPTIPQTLEEIYIEYLRPIYLLFDQFEELFILGKEQEQEEFIHTLQEIGKTKLPVRILLIIREEYLAHLYPFEKVMPTLFDRRLRVEPMTQAKAEEVILRTCGQTSIALEDPEKMPGAIIENISLKKAGIQLPYLQVYLDRLWRQTIEKEGKNPALFSWDSLREVGKIDQVLSDFLKEQTVHLQQGLSREHPGLNPAFAQQLLDRFASYQGTKVPLRKEEIELPGILPFVLSKALEGLENARILRLEEGVYELAHDSLAALIDQSRSDEQRQLNEVKIRLESGYREFQKTGEYLSRRQLSSMEEYLPRLELEGRIKQFIQASQYDATKKEKKEVQRLRITIAVVTAIAVGAVILGAWAFNQKQQASDNLRKFQSTQADKVTGEVKNILERAATLHNKGYSPEPVLLVKEAKSLLEGNQGNPLLQNQIQVVDSLLKVYEQ